MISLPPRPQRLALLLLLLLAGLAYVVVHLWLLDEAASPSPALSDAEARELAAFEDELRADSLRRMREAAAGRERHFADGDRTPELFPFDPNAADSLTLLRLGLRPWQAGNMLKYRRRGGRWRSADDFARLYGLSEADFRRLRPYIRIVPDERELRRREQQRHYDSLRATYPQKYAEGTVLDLNSADTTELKHIPGIGSYRAQQICRYRERLGGFVAISQLHELDGLPDGIERWFSVAPDATTDKIKINKASFKELVRHPYLSYEQTKEIVNHIRLHGPLRSWQDLRLSKEFTEADFRRLQPYFEF